MRGKLSDYYTQEDKENLAFIWTPLLKAMAAGVKELEVTPEEFVNAMRSAILANVYHYVEGNTTDQTKPYLEGYPTILAMRVIII